MTSALAPRPDLASIRAAADESLVRRSAAQALGVVLMGGLLLWSGLETVAVVFTFTGGLVGTWLGYRRSSRSPSGRVPLAWGLPWRERRVMWHRLARGEALPSDQIAIGADYVDHLRVLGAWPFFLSPALALSLIVTAYPLFPRHPLVFVALGAGGFVTSLPQL